MKYQPASLVTFFIRDLLLATVIVALAVGWFIVDPNGNETADGTHRAPDSPQRRQHERD
jgi:hypothetical protein